MKCQWKNAHNIIDQTFKISSSEKNPTNFKYFKFQYLIKDSFQMLKSAVQVPIKTGALCFEIAV